jgi:MerR family mercuric resistance operon transcriptional regulator
MLIGELARAAGVNVQTVRYYERLGLVLPDHRSAAGYRHYGPQEIARLRRIKQAQRLGFKLAEVRTIFASRDVVSIRKALRSAGERKAQELEARIDELNAIRQRLLSELESCGCGVGSPCTFESM